MLRPFARTLSKINLIRNSKIINKCSQQVSVFLDRVELPFTHNTQTLSDGPSLISVTDQVTPLLKPDSHMPPMQLLRGHWYCLGYCSDMRTEVADNIGHYSLYRRHACEVHSSSTLQACLR